MHDFVQPLRGCQPTCFPTIFSARIYCDWLANISYNHSSCSALIKTRNFLSFYFFVCVELETMVNTLSVSKKFKELYVKIFCKEGIHVEVQENTKPIYKLATVSQLFSKTAVKNCGVANIVKEKFCLQL